MEPLFTLILGIVAFVYVVLPVCGGIVALAVTVWALVYWFQTLVRVLRVEQGDEKIVWVLVVLFANFIGAVIYNHIRRPAPRPRATAENWLASARPSARTPNTRQTETPLRNLWTSGGSLSGRSGSDIADFGLAFITRNKSDLPEGDWGKLGKALLERDKFYLPDGDLGKLGKALLERDKFYLPDGDLGKLGKALLERDEFYLPDGDLGRLGKAILRRDIDYLSD